MNDRTVRAAIARGASTVEELTAHCSAASGCGGCWPELERLIGEHGRNDSVSGAVAVA